MSGSGAGITREDVIALVNEARRAPSVHNIQPARWALAEPGALLLYADPARSLPVADPSGHDVRLSLGAAYEGMLIALASRGLTAAPAEQAPAVAPDQRVAPGGHAPAGERVAWLPIERGATPDPLAAAVARRAAYRGTFAPTSAATLDALERRVAPTGVVVVRDRARIEELAKLADQASAEFLSDPRYWPETWRWLRLSRSHPDWDRDGLNAEALALSGIERALGRGLMAPPAFEWMRRLGLAGALISERAKIASAGALLLFTAPTTEDPFKIGRAFYRRWLEVTDGGLALCPISVLADSKRSNAEIRRAFSLPSDRRLVNVFRVGAAPPGFPARLTPRLPAAELIVS